MPEELTFKDEAAAEYDRAFAHHDPLHGSMDRNASLSESTSTLLPFREKGGRERVLR